MIFFVFSVSIYSYALWFRVNFVGSYMTIRDFVRIICAISMYFLFGGPNALDQWKLIAKNSGINCNQNAKLYQLESDYNQVKDDKIAHHRIDGWSHQNNSNFSIPTPNEI